MKAMRMLNGVLVVLWGAGSIITMSQQLGDLWSLAGALLGVIVWTAPYYYAWRAFGPTATLKLVRIARRWNIGILVAIGVAAFALGVFTVVTTNSQGSTTWLSLLPALLAFLVVAVPAVLNIRALRGRLAGVTSTPEPRPS